MHYTDEEKKVIDVGDGRFIPCDEANADYQEIMRLVDAGELTIAEPDA